MDLGILTRCIVIGMAMTLTQVPKHIDIFSVAVQRPKSQFADFIEYQQYGRVAASKVFKE